MNLVKRPPVMSTVGCFLVIAAVLTAFSSASPAQHSPAVGDDRQSQQDATANNEEFPAQWLDRLPKQDRTLLDENIGYAPPQQTDDLQWIGSEPIPWDNLRGKVVVIQSWSSRNTSGRTIPQRLQDVATEINNDDLQLLALHTPDGADTVEKFLGQRAAPMPVVVDTSGAFCDALGVYRRPVNIVIDRIGNVRYAGLRFAALVPAVQHLLDEPFDARTQPTSRPKPTTAGPTDFPAFTGAVSHATDLRGRKAPEFHVAEWVTAQPNATDKVVVIDFWATWCGPCIAAIPHMNELAGQFADDVVCIGISSESRSKYNAGMNKLAARNVTPQSFHYPIALDSKRTMQQAAKITGIPHVLVMSSDWIVRWQGHPSQLTTQALGQIVAANRTLVGNNDDLHRYRWTRGRS